MTYIVGRSGVLQAGAGVIEGVFNFSVSSTDERIEITSLGSTEKEYMNTGLDDASISFEFYLDPDASANTNIMQEGQSFAYLMRFDDLNLDPYVNGNMYIDEVSVSVGVNDAVTVSISATGTATVVKTI